MPAADSSSEAVDAPSRTESSATTFPRGGNASAYASISCSVSMWTARRSADADNCSLPESGGALSCAPRRKHRAASRIFSNATGRSTTVTFLAAKAIENSFMMAAGRNNCAIPALVTHIGPSRHGGGAVQAAAWNRNHSSCEAAGSARFSCDAAAASSCTRSESQTICCSGAKSSGERPVAEHP